MRLCAKSSGKVLHKSRVTFFFSLYLYLKCTPSLFSAEPFQSFSFGCVIIFFALFFFSLSVSLFLNFILLRRPSSFLGRPSCCFIFSERADCGIISARIHTEIHSVVITKDERGKRGKRCGSCRRCRRRRFTTLMRRPERLDRDDPAPER